MLYTKEILMANKPIKRCSTSFVIKEMQIQTSVAHKCTRTGMAKDTGQPALSYCGKQYNHFGKLVGNFL